MTPDEFANKVQDIIAMGKDDPELMHGNIDDLVFGLLRELGYGKGIDMIEDDSVELWYA